MNAFGMFFEEGFNHIADWSGLDHILFVMVLSLRYQFSDWRKILILVTAFTIGHSITLALSVFNVIDYSLKWIEFLIPVTIMITALNNTFVKKETAGGRFPTIYFFALFFGLIHGMAFSSRLKSLLGTENNIVWELLGFNLGLEAGQIMIVLGCLLISFIITYVFRCNRREYILYFSGGIFALALQWAIERRPF